jgi:Uma2 family endonuclease
MSHGVAMPDHLLTIDEWDALDVKDDGDRCELVEGVLVVTPRPGLHHQFAAYRLVELLNEHLPDELLAVFDVEVAVDERFPATLRAPDVVVVPTVVYDSAPKRLSGAEVVVAVEIVSPGTARTDRVMKFAEYQQAGIEHYWIVDLEADGSRRFEVYRRVGSSYQRLPVLDGDIVSITEPAAMRFGIGDLTRRRRNAT